jgi:hypothetical protein
MNKYLLIVILNLPIAIIGILWSTASYKTKSMTKKRYRLEVLFWVLIVISLISIEPIYNILIRANLTDSSPLSLIDIAALTLIVFCLFLIERLQEKITDLNKKFSTLHEEIVILKAEENIE